MLRAANIDDLPFVHALYMHETISPFMAFDPMPVGAFRPHFEELLESVQFLIYEEAGRRVAMGQIQWGTLRFVHSVHLGGIAIVPELQGQGIGTRLMREVMTILRSRKILRVELCVSADNSGGIAFYEKLGFQREGTMKNYFSRAGRDGFFDEHMMALFL